MGPAARRVRLAGVLFLVVLSAPGPQGASALEPMLGADPVCVSIDVRYDHGGGQSPLPGSGSYPGPACASGLSLIVSGESDTVESVGRFVYVRRTVSTASDHAPDAGTFGSELLRRLPARPAEATGGTVRVEIGWHLRYGWACDDVVAAFALLVDGQGVRHDGPDAAFARALCLVLTGRNPVDVGARAASALVALAIEGGSMVPREVADGLSPLLDGLRSTFPGDTDVSAEPPSAEGIAADGGGNRGSVEMMAGSLDLGIRGAIEDEGPLGTTGADVSISTGALVRPGPEASPFFPAAPRLSTTPTADAVNGVRGGTRPNAFVLQRDRGDEWSSIGTLGKPAGGRPPSATSSAPGPVASPPSGALVLAAAVASLVGLLAAALYSRISRSTVLDHPARAALYAAATRREAGATSTELAVDAGIDRKTAQYHLVYLVRLGLLRERTCPDGPRRFLAPAARSPPEESPALADLVLGIVALRPGIATAEIARVLSATPTRIERRVKDLLLAGRLSTRVDGGVRRLFVP